MIAVLTGDIISSSKLPDKHIWLDRLKWIFSEYGGSTGIRKNKWEIYRGDSFQLESAIPENSFLTALLIRSGIKSVAELYENKVDVRIAIGIGEPGFAAEKVSESDGEAYRFSGRLLDKLKNRNIKLAVKTRWEDFDREMEVSFHLSSAIMDDWSLASAEVAWLRLLSNKTQKELAGDLKISQPAVHKRLMKSHIEDILLLKNRFRNRITHLIQNG